MTDELVQPPRPRPVINALFHAGMARPRMRPEVDLCPHAFLGIELYRYGAIIDPACYKLPERRRVYVENDPRNLDGQAHAGLILPEGLQ